MRLDLLDTWCIHTRKGALQTTISGISFKQLTYVAFSYNFLFISSANKDHQVS